MIQIPGYRLVRELGSGASGTVHLAVQEALERSVAVKILAPGLFDAEQTRARFEREAKVQARLDHPNLLRVLDAGFAGDTPYLVMELVEGGSLRDRLDKQGRLPAAEAVSVAAAIASGLAHAHAMGIVHRDLKPENVLFTGEGLAQVADFGLAKTSTAGESVRTATGIILGTPGYMAPEVLCGEAAGQAADVYGLGAMLYEAISGRKPFVHENLGKLLGMQLKTQPTKLSELASGVTQALETLVESCLAPAPGERPASAVLARRLTVLAAELATGPTPGAARATAAVRSAGAPGDSGIRKAPANPTPRPLRYKTLTNGTGMSRSPCEGRLRSAPFARWGK
ncbi:MAG: serine/threonine protein kinase, partial [Candidatus Wallbacteria bacterium]|nr:serine/threonine protein kinase [Candidatus Wallbacteria bacterium]